MQIKSFKDLRVWREAHALTLEIYAATEQFPADERFGLVMQMRRSAASVPTNIAEGMGRQGTKDLIRFIYIARGSIQETIYHCTLAKDLGYLGVAASERLVARYDGLTIGLQTFIKKLQNKKPNALHSTS